MKRLALVLLVLIGAAAGAYAQVALQEEQPSTAVVQNGILYGASFCVSDPNWQYGLRPQYSFFMRPTRQLADGWIEAEVAQRVTVDSRGAQTFVPEKAPTRLNLHQMCEISVAELRR
jgi:hypothetical protein